MPERPDCSYVIKELARHVAHPTAQDWASLKRVLRYISGTTSAELQLSADKSAQDIQCYVDASWASDVLCKGTSAGLLYVNGFLCNHWSRTQPTIALSSCEAEIIALNVGGVESLYVKTLLEEISKTSTTAVTLYTDSSSGKATLQRRGFGRLRHLRVKDL